MSEKKFLPERLISVREHLGITSAEAARKTGIKKEMMWKYENGISAPAEPTLRIISLYLGTSAAYLCGETDDPGPDMLVVKVGNDPDKAQFVWLYDQLSGYQKKLIIAVMKELST